MKTIFLDIDGVLKPALDSSDGPHGLNTNCLYRFNKLVEDLDAQIVISSDWRHALSIHEFNQFLNNRVVGKTGHVPNAGGGRQGHRFMELNEYCIQNNVKDYIVIDDTPDIFGMQESAWTFHFTDGWLEEPLTEEVCEQIQHCNNEPFPMELWKDLSNVICCSSVGTGWYGFVKDFVFQRKPIHDYLEKRYTFYGSDGALKATQFQFHGVEPAIRSYLETIETQSETVCELCGDKGRIYTLPLRQRWVRCERHKYLAIREYSAVEQFAQVIKKSMPSVFCLSHLYFDGFSLVESELINRGVIKKLAQRIYKKDLEKPIYVHELVDAMRVQFGVRCYPRGEFARSVIGYEFDPDALPYQWYADFLLPEKMMRITHGEQTFEFERVEVPFEFEEYQLNQLYFALCDLKEIEEVKLDRVRYKFDNDVVERVIDIIRKR